MRRSGGAHVASSISGCSSARQYLEALGARLEFVAVFGDEDRRVPIHLGRDDAA